MHSQTLAKNANGPVSSEAERDMHNFSGIMPTAPVYAAGQKSQAPGHAAPVVPFQQAAKNVAPSGNGAAPPPAPPATPPNAAGDIPAAALEYARQEWPVFPVHTANNGRCTCGQADCAKPGKHPRTARGFKDASTDENQIRDWWAKWPDANIGSPMGGSRIVIDVDGPEGEDSLRDLAERYGALPETRTARTGKGRHLYFNPDGAKIKPSAGVLGAHLDVRAEGSYVILPPSVHANGNRYEWANKDAPTSTLPDAWLKLLSAPEQPKASSLADGQKIPEGQRNARLTSLAGTMRRPGMSQAAIEAALLTENQERCNPPLPEPEVRNIARSVARYEPADRAGSETPSVQVPGILASEVTSQSVSWLWPNRIPFGKVTMFDGDPGLAKSTVSLDLAARVTRGLPMPDGTDCGCEPSGVVIVSLEDGVADTIVPRLEAAGAALERVRIITTIKGPDGIERTPTLPGDLPEIEAAIHDVSARLLVLDPLVGMLGADTNAYHDQDMRRVLAPVAALSEKTGVATVCIRHLNKSGAQNAKYRGGGSIGITGAARAVFLFGEKPGEDGRYVFAPVKGNLWRGKPSALEYSVEDRSEQPGIVWHGASSHNANSLLAMPESAEESNGCAAAREFLLETLAQGAVSANEVKREARSAGLSDTTLNRAKSQLRVQARKVGFGDGQHWEWTLPEDGQSPPKMVNNPNLTTFAEDVETKPVNSAGCSKMVNSPKYDNLRGEDDHLRGEPGEPLFGGAGASPEVNGAPESDSLEF